MVLFFIFLMLLFALILMICFLKVQEEAEENRMLRSYMASMQELYRMLHSQTDAIRRYRHDLAKHIQTLEAMVDSSLTGEDGEIEQFARHLKETYRQLMGNEICSDEIINSILQLKKQQCRQKHIRFFVYVEDADYTCIKEADMTGILYNLLDNAVEANERIPEKDARWIHVRIEKSSREIMIEVANAVKEGEQITFRTSKKNKEEHGLGTKIIQEFVEKYQGKKEIFLNEGENTLRIKITLRGCGEDD